MGLALVELVMSVEHRFGISIPNEDARLLTSPALLIDYVCTKVAATSGETRDAVAEVVRQLIREQLGLKTFSDEADFIKDLHAG